MGGNAVKKPLQKGKNRVFVGNAFGICTSPKIVKTWERQIRKEFVTTHKSKKTND